MIGYLASAFFPSENKMPLPTQLRCKVRHDEEWITLFLRADEFESHYVYATARSFDDVHSNPRVKLLIPKSAMVDNNA